MVYKAYLEKQPTETAVITTPKEDKPEMSASGAIELIGSKISYPDTTNIDAMAPSLKIEGYEFYVTPAHENIKAHLSKSTSASQAASDVNTIASTLKAAGFRERKLDSGGQDYLYSEYRHVNTACLLENAPSSNSDYERRFSIGCHDMADYYKLAEKIKPLALITPNYSNYRLAFFGANIKDSVTAGYKTADASTGTYVDGTYGVGAVVNLYYQTHDGVWQYFKSTQNILPCSNFNTEDIKKAFAGNQCADENGSIFQVKP